MNVDESPKTGKNFSANNVNGARREADFYETPYSLTRLLLSKEKVRGPVLEPACGGGAICKVLLELGINNEAYDTEPKGWGGKKDFHQETGRYKTIITNPPYSQAFEFIKKAKTVADKVIFLLPLSYLHGKERFDHVYQDRKFPLKRVYVFTRYPHLGFDLREDGKHKTGFVVYAWFVWERGAWGKPEIEWLDNQDCVVQEAKRSKT